MAETCCLGFSFLVHACGLSLQSVESCCTWDEQSMGVPTQFKGMKWVALSYAKKHQSVKRNLLVIRRGIPDSMPNANRCGISAWFARDSPWNRESACRIPCRITFGVGFRIRRWIRRGIPNSAWTSAWDSTFGMEFGVEFLIRRGMGKSHAEFRRG